VRKTYYCYHYYHHHHYYYYYYYYGDGWSDLTWITCIYIYICMCVCMGGWMGWGRFQPCVTAVRAVVEAKKALEKAGCEVVEMPLPKGKDGWEVSES